MYLEHLVPQILATLAAPRCLMHRLLHPDLVSFGMLANLVRLAKLPRFREIDTVIDVGANTGQFAYMAHVAWPTLPIHSIEPDPASFQTLEDTFRRFSIPGSCHAVAATAIRQQVTLNIQGERVNNSLLARKGELPVLSMAVDGVPLDELFEAAISIGRPLLKLDIQGTELDALRGAKRLARRAAGILVEVSLAASYEHAALPEELIGELRGLGFVIFDIVDTLRLSKADGRGLREVDLLFVPQERIA